MNGNVNNTPASSPMPPLLDVAANLVVRHDANAQMAFCVAILSRLAELNKDNPDLPGIVITGENTDDAFNFLRIIKEAKDRLSQEEATEMLAAQGASNVDSH